jgi:hypothetical protein
MSKETLEKLRKNLKVLEARGLTDSDEYERLSDEYQAIAQDLVMESIFEEEGVDPPKN